MRHLYKPQPLVLLLSTLLVLVACKKNSSSAGPAPVTEPISIAAAKPGDTIVIKGKNFSAVAANNTVTFNGVTATIVSATATELRVVIPAGATSGAVKVTVNGVTTEVGTLVLSPLTLYYIKENTNDNAPEQLVAIDPSNGQETLIATLTDIADYAIPDILYLAATNEVINYNDSGTALMKINVTTKQASSVRLAGSGPKVRFERLVTDKNGQLYAVETDNNDANNFTEKLVEVDPQTGGVTAVKTLAHNDYINWNSLVYLSSSNEIAGMVDGGRLFKLNLSTKDTSSALLANTDYISLSDLVADKQGNLIAYKIDLTNSPNNVAQFVQVNPVTGAQSVITTLSDYNAFHGALCFLPERTEIAGIWNYNSLYRFNVSSKISLALLPLTTQTNISYVKVTHN